MPESYQQRQIRLRRTPIHIQEVRNVKGADGPQATVRCRHCGVIISFTTDGNGRLLALEKLSMKLHCHQEGA